MKERPLLGRRRKRKPRFLLFAVAIVIAVFSVSLPYLFYKTYWIDEPLFSAAFNGDTKEVRNLLKRGANPNATWEDGESALQAAKANHNQEIVDLLRQAGAKD